MFAHVIAANAGAWLPPDDGSLSPLVLEEEKDHQLDEVGTEARPYAPSNQPYGMAGLVRKAMTRIRVAMESSP